MNLITLKKKCTNCKLCTLSKTRSQMVFGEGNIQTNIMFIGEAPGAKEDIAGKPFIGASGKLLDVLLRSINLERSDIFITNVIKCRPPNNRDPLKIEIQSCLPYLYKQISIIKPKVIVTLGRFAMNIFLPEARISYLHGQPQKVDNTLIIPFYHPAAALFNGSLRKTLENDFLMLKKYIE